MSGDERELEEYYTMLEQFLQTAASRVFNPQDNPNLVFDKVILLAHETSIDGEVQPGVRAVYLPSMTAFDVLGLMAVGAAHLEFHVTHRQP